MTERKLEPGGDLDADLRSALDDRLGCSKPGDDALLARVGARVLRLIEDEREGQHRTVRPPDGEWQTIARGVERKLLWSGESGDSWMLRLAPGAVVEAHLHPADEECVVLEGSVRIGPDLVLRSGDFHVGSKGSLHQRSTTETGALLYLRGASEKLPSA